eukprot:g3362.t1
MFSRRLNDLLNPKEEGRFALNTKTKEFFFSDSAPSWSELEKEVKAKALELGDPSFTQYDYLESGPPNPLSLKRTFGKAEEIRVKLYRDHAAWCPYCQKVWMQLEEKQIPYVVEKINMRCYGDKPESFYNITSAGLLPVMEFEGKNYTESAFIASLLEKEFPENPLLPPTSKTCIKLKLLMKDLDSKEYEKCMELMKLERRLFSAWCQWLCQSWAPDRQKANFETVIGEVESALAATDGPYFLGNEFTLIDIIFAPFLERMDASLAYYKGYEMRKTHPKLEKWFEGMETRPTYIASRTDYYTHAHALPPQLGGCQMTNEGVPFAKRIDGLSNGAWKLPLEPLSSKSFEPYSPGEYPAKDTYYAAKQLISNHNAVVRFALRGCGSEGSRPVMAPLSDPTAVPGMDAFQGTDAALRYYHHSLKLSTLITMYRHIAQALLIGVEAKQSEASSHRVFFSDEAASGLVSGKDVIPSLVYGICLLCFLSLVFV